MRRDASWRRDCEGHRAAGYRLVDRIEAHLSGLRAKLAGFVTQWVGPMVGEIEKILDSLNRARVRYLVVGGVAVVLHGYLRTTADLDLVIQLERGNVLRAMTALGNLQYRPRAPVPAEAFAQQEVRQQWIREKGLTVFSLWSPAHPTLEIDLFVSEPFDFEAVYSRALPVPLERAQATVIALDDLIALKRQVGRPRDQEDVAALESLRDAEGQPGEGSDA